jgi:hypothetical protein
VANKVIVDEGNLKLFGMERIEHRPFNTYASVKSFDLCINFDGKRI